MQKRWKPLKYQKYRKFCFNQYIFYSQYIYLKLEKKLLILIILTYIMYFISVLIFAFSELYIKYEWLAGPLNPFVLLMGGCAGC